LLTVTDPLGRIALRHLYDLADRALRTEQLDAGLRRLMIDAVGNTLEQRDSKGALRLSAYDAANRPVRLWARDGAGQPLTLRESLIYGDSEGIGLTAEQAAAKNLLGKSYKHYEEAGLLSFEAYDCKGNLLEKSRQAIGDAAILAVFTSPSSNWQVKTFRVEWQSPPGTTLEAHASRLLDPMVYRTSLAYDALNRLKTMRYPQDVSGVRKELRPRYNRAGALERVELDGRTYVERIAYNAKGQRTLSAYGNGVLTRYAYDPKTFRLVRMRTERYTKPSAFTYHPTGGAPLQDFAYEYDLAGNLLALRDRTPGSGLSTKPNALDRSFAYDPLYHLISATGRECDVPPSVPWNVDLRCTDITKTRAYTETYQYDPAGNLGRLAHQAATGAFTRVLTLIPNNNRLATMSVGAKTYAYAYDASGNLLRENASRHFEWDHTDRMRVYRTQVGDAEPSVHAHYLYDSGGQRVKKLVRKQGQVEVSVYVDGVFEHQRVIATGTTRENNTLHVMDNQSRIAQVRVGNSFSGDTTPAMKYHLGDHLGSSNVAIDETGSWVNREEYTPYGETGFGSFARKRYRFTGKERDEESGLSYHGARYYAPWLARWVSSDPAGIADGLNTYVYVRDNPLRLIDPAGTQAQQSAPPAPLVNNVEDVAAGEARQAAFEAGPQMQAGAKAQGIDPLTSDKATRNKLSSRQGQLTMDKLKTNLAESAKANRYPGASRKLTPEVHIEQGIFKSAGGNPKPTGRNPDLGVLKQEIPGVDPAREWNALAGQKATDVFQQQTFDVKVGGGYVRDKAHFAKETGLTATELRPFGKATLDLGADAAETGSKAVARAPGKLAKLASGAGEVLVKKGGKVITGIGTGVGVALAAKEFYAGNYAAAFVEAVGASEIPILAQVADIGSLTADIAWVAKDVFDPEQKLEQLWYETFLK
jgi:RHS repeat-associated protein